MSDWLVAVAKYQRERDAFDELTGAGLDCYQPRFREKITVRHRRVLVDRFLLGRYILVKFTFDWWDWFYSFVGVRWVHGALMCDERPMLAREAEVDKLRGCEVRGYVPAPRNVPLTGAAVKVNYGAFRYHSAKFSSRDDDAGVDRVLVQLFGTLTPLTVPIGAWEPA